MTQARHKKAVDYEAPKGLPDNRSAAEVAADLERVRDEMTETVNELAARLHPDTLKEEATSFAKDKAAEGKVLFADFVEKVKAGDRQSIAIVAGAALGLAIIVLRKIFK
ncbi:DUF3618 domain-containing protein [Trueperella bialowiezensis]|uniref:Protein of uncharacterized function (DUF3618) n=1 Tax=Trueperella bialowiezensis TaxID=312285 RepID=A0A3S4VB17_9ACTO|nr:DUF3618 domain-containing protein [Trueperella bialowiezensis]VEI13582.1 Protein of uncharacterised function (DUF3618) [Trueperella bialowiezensis]